MSINPCAFVISVPSVALQSPSSSTSSIIQRLQFRGKELAVFADQFAVEVDFAAAVVGALDIDEVPVDLAHVAVVGAAFVSLAGGKVEAAGDLFIEQYIAHRLHLSLIHI